MQTHPVLTYRLSPKLTQFVSIVYYLCARNLLRSHPLPLPLALLSILIPRINKENFEHYSRVSTTPDPFRELYLLIHIPASPFIRSDLNLQLPLQHWNRNDLSTLHCE
jgi:hypothetical protein